MGKLGELLTHPDELLPMVRRRLRFFRALHTLTNILSSCCMQLCTPQGMRTCRCQPSTPANRFFV
jgi:hypothetical protein